MRSSWNMPYNLGMSYGTGIDGLNGDVAGSAVTFGEPAPVPGAGGQAGDFQLTLVKSYEELYTALGISIEASGHYGLFSAGAKFDFTNKVKFNSQATIMVARASVVNAFTQVLDASLKPEATELLRTGKAELFRRRYGDGYVRGILTGGEFYGVISISSQDREEETQISAQLNAEYNGLVAGGSFSASVQNSSNFKSGQMQIEVHTDQRGGSGEQMSFTGLSVSTMLARMREFAEIVELQSGMAVPYQAQVASYQTLPSPEPNLVLIEQQRIALTDYARKRLDLLTRLNDIDFVRQHLDYFENPPSVDTLNRWNQQFTDQLNQVMQAATGCSNDMNACPLISIQFPADYAMPRRVVGQMVLVPNVMDLFHEEAAATVTAAGLQCEKNWVSRHEGQRANFVLEQLPMPGSEITKGSTIRITIPKVADFSGGDLSKVVLQPIKFSS
jgi:hypothetical protein